MSRRASQSADGASLEGWLTTQNKDDARDKAVASHETMGLVSVRAVASLTSVLPRPFTCARVLTVRWHPALCQALLAGFELAALVEVDTCVETTECSAAESLFVITASFCVGLSTIVVLETSFEYMFVMRELHHGAASAWNLISHFRFCRRAAEIAFALEIMVFLVSTGFMVYVRFAKTLPIGTTVSIVLLALNMAFTFAIVGALQHAKWVHGHGARQKREEALIEQQRLRVTRADKRGSLNTSSLKMKRISAMLKPGFSTCQVGCADAGSHPSRTSEDGAAVRPASSKSARFTFRRAATAPRLDSARDSECDDATEMSVHAAGAQSLPESEDVGVEPPPHPTAVGRESTLEKQLNSAVQRAQAANLLNRKQKLEASDAHTV